MTNSLIEKLAKNRAHEVEVDRVKFSIRLPSFSRLYQHTSTDAAHSDLAKTCVNGWSGVTEADIIEDGDVTKNVPWSAELFYAVIEDRPTWYHAIFNECARVLMERQRKFEGAEKNS